MAGQRINLYQDELKEPWIILPARQLLLLLCLVLLLAAGWAAWMQYRLAEPQEKAASLTAEAARLASEVESLERVIAQQKRSETLLRRADGLADKVQRLEGLARLVAQPVEAKPLHSFLNGLAAARPENLWLREILLGPDGRSLLLRGSTLEAAQLPRFLTALGRQEAFAGLTFDHLAVSRRDDDDKVLDFIVSSRCPPGAETPADCKGGGR